MSVPPIRFDGQVAIVTGAGAGMGREYALELAGRGARVLVNDYGGDMFGEGGSSSPADAVAEEIGTRGGEALSVDEPVGSADAARIIVGHALDAFGRVDILINNAGISAPGPLDAASDERIEAVMATNLMGPLHLTRAVWPAMKRQGYGRIVNVSSGAALGKGRSLPYAVSKSGLLGLTLESACEGAAHGIRANAVMPTAYSRMIEAVPDKAFVAWMREHMPASQVAAAVVYLVSRQCSETGRIFTIGGGRVARIAYAASRGFRDPQITAERAAEQIAEATSMHDLEVLEGHADDVRLHRIGDMSAG